MAKRRPKGKGTRRSPGRPGAESPSSDSPGGAEPADDWAKWRRNEAQLDAGADEQGRDRAPPELSGELAWYWRAMQTLSDGHRDEALQLAAEASVGNPKVAWLLRTLLADPAKLDPSELRKAAKQAGVGAGAGDPTLDLLRVLACCRTGKPSQRSSTLSKAARQRRVLRATLDLMQRRKLHDDSLFHLDHHSPRLKLLWLASSLRESGSSDVRGSLMQPCGEEKVSAAFPIERWPDLDAGAGDLRSWLASDGAGLDSADFQLRLHDEIALLCSGPEEERQSFLAALLAHCQRLLAGPSPIVALPLVRAAAQLAESMTDLDGLAAQLAHLEARLLWFDRKAAPVTPDLIEELWRHLQSNPLAERAVVARHICEELEAFEPAIGAEAACICIVASSSGEERRRDAGLFGQAPATSALEASLEEAGDLRVRDWERLVVIGQHHRVCGRGIAAADIARELVEHPEAGGEGARLLAELALETAGQSGLAPGGPKLQASLRRRDGRNALLKALSALSRCEEPQRVVPLIPALPALFAHRKTAAALAELRTVVEAALAHEQAATRTANFEWALAYLAIGNEEQAAQAFRDFGRRLRRAAGGQGRRPRAGDSDRPDRLAPDWPAPGTSPLAGDSIERVALQAAGRLSDVASLRLPRPIRSELKGWLDSITAFLSRWGPEALDELIESHRIRQPEEVAGIAQWCLANLEKLDDESCWHGLLAQGLVQAAAQDIACVRAYAQRHVIPFIRQLSEEEFEEVFAGLSGLLGSPLPPDLH